MALYRCGGGSGSAPVLISKNISENGTYNAQDDSADGYSSVTVGVSGGYVVMNTATWDTKTFMQKKAQGLTLIKDNSVQSDGTWVDLSNAAVEIIKEFFSDSQETIAMQPQNIYHLIYMQGMWSRGSDHDSTVISHSNITYDSVDTGSINAYYSGFNNKLVTILHDVTVGNNASITIARGYSGVTDGGGVFAIPFDSTCELIGEHFGSNTDTITTTDDYDYVLFISNKWNYNGSSNGVYTISDGTLTQIGKETISYAGSSSYAMAVYSNVPTGTTITLGNGLTNVQDSVVAIGIKEAQS